MKKFCCVLIFFCLCFVTGCGCNQNPQNYYFYFQDNIIELNVGESLDLFTLKTNTNITSFDKFEVEKNDKISLDKKDKSKCMITALKAGRTKINIIINYSGQEIKTSLELNILEISSDKGLKYNYTREIIEENVIINIKVLKNEASYIDFSCEIKTNNGELVEPNISFNNIQFVVKNSAIFSVKITDNADNSFISILSTDLK